MNETRAYRLKSAARDIVWGARDVLSRPTSGMRVLPDYLIVGAQRGGTTSLQDLISSHPDVRPPFLRKGIHYFDTGFSTSCFFYCDHTFFTNFLHRFSDQLSNLSIIIC